MLVFLIGLILFLGVHSVRIVADDWRSARIAQWGEGAWKGLYSVASLAGLVLLVWGYGQTRATPIDLWQPPVFTRHLASLLTLPAFILLAAPDGARREALGLCTSACQRQSRRRDALRELSALGGCLVQRSAQARPRYAFCGCSPRSACLQRGTARKRFAFRPRQSPGLECSAAGARRTTTCKPLHNRPHRSGRNPGLGGFPSRLAREPHWREPSGTLVRVLRGVKWRTSGGASARIFSGEAFSVFPKPRPTAVCKGQGSR